MKTIVIVTDYSKEIGYGHISRCLALYDGLISNYKVILAIDADGLSADALDHRDWYNINWHKDIKLLDIYKESVFIVDSLIINQTDLDYLFKISSRFIVIDDYCRRNYSDSLIIDWTPNADKNGFHSHNSNRNNRLLLGLRYAILRSAFSLKDEYVFRPLNAITIILGGTDIRSLSFPITSYLSKIFPDISFNLVCSQKFDFKSDNVNCYSNLNAIQIKSLFYQSDIVISAGGQTLFELASIGVPTIPIKVADNQSDDLIGFVDLRFFDEYFVWDDPFLLYRLKDKITCLYDINTRKSNSEFFLFSNIGNGVLEILTQINTFINEDN